MKRKTPTPFSSLLVSLMEENQMTVREAARTANVSPSTITAWRSGGRPEDFLAVKKLAKALGVSMSFLLTGEEDRGPSFAGEPVSAAFEKGPVIFDGYAEVTIRKLLPRGPKKPR